MCIISYTKVNIFSKIKLQRNNMKKILKRIAALSCAALLTTSCTACFGTEKDVVNAYDVAVKNGFVGTEEEWLNSLRGANGKDAESISIDDAYEAAKKNGFTGSYLEFLKEYLDVRVNEDNDTETIAENMMSVVSIYCAFTTRQGSDWWNLSTELSCSAGSGVIIDLNKEAGNALIVTNYHVVYNSKSSSTTHISDSIYLYTYGALNMFSTETGTDVGGDGLKATYVGGAMDYDIAILKVEGSEFLRNSEVRAAKLGDSENVQIGEKVYAIGNPDGAGLAVTNGIVSVESEFISMSATDATDGDTRTVSYRVIRTDAAINHGNSGGGLFNAKGELIGITNAKNASDDVDNMGYALPITQVKYLCENLTDNGGVVKRAMLGINVTIVSSNAVMEDGKLKIYEEFSVASESIAKTAISYNKLNFGDIIKSVTIIPAGEKSGQTNTLHRRYQLNDLLLTVRLGDTVILTVLRDGSEQTIELVFDNEAYFTTY